MFDYFAFKKMISGLLIKLLHIIGLLSITIYGIYQIFQNDFIQGLVTIIVGNLLWRIICEGMIILFSIHDRLASIDYKTVPGFDPRSQQY
mgnify:CR=1 FL=1